MDLPIRQASNKVAQAAIPTFPERSQVYRKPMAKPSKIFSLVCF